MWLPFTLWVPNMGQRNLKTQTTFQTLQNRALKKITFKKRKDSATCIYKDLKILKFRDFLCFHLNKILKYCLLLKFFTVDTPTTINKISNQKYVRYTLLTNLHLWHQVSNA